jgi:hypothetical protein
MGEGKGERKFHKEVEMISFSISTRKNHPLEIVKTMKQAGRG